MNRITESPSLHRHLEKKSTLELLQAMNEEDASVPKAVASALHQIEALVDATHEALAAGGRLFYIGAGTSGRLGVVDASECPPTFGVPHGLVVGIIAGGDSAIRKAVEFAEDSESMAWNDLAAYDVTSIDVVVGLAASGTTPYVIGGLREAKKHGIKTGCIVCNAASPIAALADFPVEVVVGPEFITGSTRLKSGTAQKLVLNMLTTSVMIKLGRVVDNRMVDMQLSNNKLWQRGVLMIQEKYDVTAEEARQALETFGSVRAAQHQFEQEGRKK